MSLLTAADEGFTEVEDELTTEAIVAAVTYELRVLRLSCILASIAGAQEETHAT